MQTIKENLQINSDILLESVIDKHIQMLINQLVKIHVKPKDVFDKLKINASDVDPSRIRVYKDIDKDAMKDIEKAMDSSEHYVFGIKNELVCLIYFSKPGYREGNHYIWIPTKEGHVFGTWSSTSENPLYNYKENSKSISKCAKIFEHCDEVWILNYSKSLLKSEIQKQRSNSRYGMWENTPAFYAKVLKDNLERYKTQGAIMRMNKGSEFESVMKDVSDFINKVTEKLLDMHKNIEKGKWGYEYRLKNLMQDVNRIAQRVLSNIDNILSSQREYEENKNNEWDGSEYYIRQYREYIKDVKEILKEGKEKYDLLISEIEKFNSKSN